MILITGAPRTGTTYLMNLLAELEGYELVPPKGAKSSDSGKLRSNEPKFLRGVRDYTDDVALDLWKLSQSGTSEDKEVIVKHHEVHPILSEAASRFSKIIFTTRKIDSWMQSAQRHGNTWFRATEGRPPHFLELGLRFNECYPIERLWTYGLAYNNATTKKWEQALSAGYDCFLFRYEHGQVAVQELLKWLGVDEGRALELSETFTGSRWGRGLNEKGVEKHV